MEYASSLRLQRKEFSERMETFMILSFRMKNRSLSLWKTEAIYQLILHSHQSFLHNSRIGALQLYRNYKEYLVYVKPITIYELYLDFYNEE